MRAKQWLICFTLLFLSLPPLLFSSDTPADFSFLIVDLKYSEDQGVKICEVQQGILSTFFGDRFCHGEPGLISSNFTAAVAKYFEKGWAITRTFSEINIQEALKHSPMWSVKSSLKQIIDDTEFSDRAKLAVYDPDSLHHYHGLLAAPPSHISDYETFKHKFAGIVLMDSANHPYWVDKYKMSQLFNNNATLATFKPKWGIYKKNYTKGLVHTILTDMKSELVVIKPRGTFLGNGVIIVAKKDLDHTLKYILNGGKKLLKDADWSYRYWYYDPFDTFLVEAFAPSDPIRAHHLDSGLYHPTLRVAFVMAYHNQAIEITFLGEYWLLPIHSLEEGGTPNEIYKACCKEPFFLSVSKSVLSSVQQQLLVALPLLYQEMLKN